MNRVYASAILILLIFVAGAFATGYPDFVPADSASVMVITHNSLRTSGWYPGMSGAWETKLLAQKTQQGLKVAHHDLGDGVGYSDVRSYIHAHTQNLRYVLIFGDWDRPEDTLAYPIHSTTNASAHRFVPVCDTLVANEVWDPNYHYPLENDRLYVRGLNNVTIGRIPVANNTELQSYLDKSQEYLNLTTPTWARKELLSFCDDWCNWTQCPPEAVHACELEMRADAPSNWTLDTLYTMDYSTQTARDDAFRNAVNSGYGVVYNTGTAAHVDNLNFFFVRSSSEAFSDTNKYPLLLGFACSIGAIQRPDSCDSTNGCIYYDKCAVERLLFRAHAGIIGAIAPTNYTIYEANLYLTRMANVFLTQENLRSFGGLWQALVSVNDSISPDQGYPDWMYENLMLIGDPTLHIPVAPQGYGHWTLDVSPVVIDDSLHVTNGNELIIDPGVAVRFGTNGALVVDAGAKLTVEGTAAAHVTFDVNSGSSNWKGIFVNGGQINMVYADVYHASPYCVYTEAATAVTIDHCVIDGSQVGTGGIALRIWNSPSNEMCVDNTTIQNVPGNGNGTYLFNSFVKFVNDTIRNCSYVNSYVKKVTGAFIGCVFSGRASYYSVMFNEATCTPNFQCCLFDNVAPQSGSFMSSIYCLSGTSPSFGWEYSTGSSGVSNVTRDTSAYLMTMQGSGVLPIVDNTSQQGGPGGHNDWYQFHSSPKFFQWTSPPSKGTYMCESQYWSPSVDTNKFTPTTKTLWDFTPYQSSAWGVCGTSHTQGIGGGLTRSSGTHHGQRGLDDPDWADLFGHAMALEDSGSYGDAQNDFHQVASESPDSMLRWYAATHVVTTAAHLPSDNGWVSALVDSLINVENSRYDVYVYGHRILTSHLMNRHEYSDALSNCTDLLNHGLTFDDSILVAMDLIGVQFAAGLIEYQGGLDAAGRSVPAGLKVRSAAQGMELETHLLHILGTGGHADSRAQIPTRYALYQNYPNPFNPTTEIRFDLPEATRVELRIFNTLGQLVTTLTDEVRPAGAYTLTWNGQSKNGASVASGLYIYQIKTAKFTDSKKMLLIR